MKLWFKKKYKSFRFRLSANNHFFFRAYYKFFYKPKAGSLASTIDQISSAANEPIRVMQVGANDGITHDPIHKFIKRDHWRGVLLEPQEEVFNQFLSKLYQKDEGISTLNAALGPKDEQANLYKIAFSNKRWATGLATFNKQVLLDAFKDGRIERFAAKYGDQIPQDEIEWIHEDKIQMMSVSSVLKRAKMEAVDLLMIDTEGYDFEIIKLVIKENILPQYIIFEHHHFSEEEYKQCMSFLKIKKYNLKEFDGNTLASISY